MSTGFDTGRVQPNVRNGYGGRGMEDPRALYRWLMLNIAVFLVFRPQKGGDLP